MMKYEIEVVGETPLLMNRFVGSGDNLSPTKKKVITTKVVAIEDKLYTLEGKYYIPARYFEGALIEAGKSFKGKGKATLSKIMGSMVSISPEAIILTNQKWIEDVQVGVNPMTKGRMQIRRPRFDKWGAKFELTVSTDDIPRDIMQGVLIHAGLYVGVGDWRPAKKGKYGKFTLKTFNEL